MGKINRYGDPDLVDQGYMSIYAPAAGSAVRHASQVLGYGGG
jgi:hypothetical protein